MTRLCLHGLQDGGTHWDWERPEHGFNFMCQLYTSTAENGVWAVPFLCVNSESRHFF